MPNILLIGTSRLHRPFAKRVNKLVVTNVHEGVEVTFPKVGYFHTAAEALQVIRFLKNPSSIPYELRKYIFRVEPRPTTPLNEFSQEFEVSIRSGAPYSFESYLPSVACLVVEVSSLSVNLHVPSGCVLHTNPNFVHNVPYADIYPDGYYQKVEPSLPVVKVETDRQMLTDHLGGLRAELPGRQIIVLGHLQSRKHPNSHRARLNQLLEEASRATGCVYFDTAPFLDEYGLAEVSGVKDIHHLSDQGESEIGRAIQLTASTLVAGKAS